MAVAFEGFRNCLNWSRASDRCESTAVKAFLLARRLEQEIVSEHYLRQKPEPGVTGFGVFC